MSPLCSGLADCSDCFDPSLLDAVDGQLPSAQISNISYWKWFNSLSSNFPISSECPMGHTQCPPSKRLSPCSFRKSRHGGDWVLILVAYCSLLSLIGVSSLLLFGVENRPTGEAVCWWKGSVERRSLLTGMFLVVPVYFWSESRCFSFYRVDPSCLWVSNGGELPPKDSAGGCLERWLLRVKVEENRVVCGVAPQTVHLGPDKKALWTSPGNPSSNACQERKEKKEEPCLIQEREETPRLTVLGLRLSQPTVKRKRTGCRLQCSNPRRFAWVSASCIQSHDHLPNLQVEVRTMSPQEIYLVDRWRFQALDPKDSDSQLFHAVPSEIINTIIFQKNIFENEGRYLTPLPEMRFRKSSTVIGFFQLQRSISKEAHKRISNFSRLVDTILIIWSNDKELGDHFIW